jgi:hypothetical protein
VEGNLCDGEMCTYSEECYLNCCDSSVCVDNSAGTATCSVKPKPWLIVIMIIVGLLIVFAFAIFCIVQCKKQTEVEVQDMDDTFITRETYDEHRSIR